MTVRCFNFLLFTAITFMFNGLYQPVLAQKNNSQILWYDTPAKNWNEALPLGNGKLGVMVFGNPNTERIQLNDDSLWPGAPGDWNEPEGTREDIETIRTLLINNQTEAADSLFVSKFSRKRIVRSHQTLGDLYITFKNHDKISHYRRDLDISKAIASVTYQTNKHQISQEVLVSNPHKVIAIKLSSNTPLSDKNCIT